MPETTIRSITVEPFEVPFPESFPIATGAFSEAKNVLITMTLADGSVGYGECAPFAPSSGESQATALAAAQECSQLLQGQDAAHWRQLSKLISSLYYAQKSVCAGMEMAILDALTHSYGIPLYIFFGGASSTLETDWSIALVTPEHAVEIAGKAVARGIRRIKVKVGGGLLEDLARVEAIYRAFPTIGLSLDANQGYTPSEALLCLQELERRGIRPLLLEQPVQKDDYQGLRYVTEHTTVPVAADESAGSSAEVARLLAMGAVNVINIKLMKSGLVDSLTIAALCRATNTQLMIGSMPESRLAISASAHFAAGVGGFSYIDLDSAMEMVSDPFTGGYDLSGGIYDLSGIQHGLGIEKR